MGGCKLLIYNELKFYILPTKSRFLSLFSFTKVKIIIKNAGRITLFFVFSLLACEKIVTFEA